MSSESIADLIFESITPDPSQAGQWEVGPRGLERIEQALRSAVLAGDPAPFSREAMSVIGFLMQRGDAPSAVDALLTLARRLLPLVAEALEETASSGGVRARVAASMLGPRLTKTTAEDAAELDRRGKVTRLSLLAPKPIRLR